MNLPNCGQRSKAEQPRAELTLGRTLERLGDVHVVDDVGLDAVAAPLNLRTGSSHTGSVRRQRWQGELRERTGAAQTKRDDELATTKLTLHCSLGIL